MPARSEGEVVAIADIGVVWVAVVVVGFSGLGLVLGDAVEVDNAVAEMTTSTTQGFASWNLPHRWAAVAEISGEYAGNGPTGDTLTLVSYLGGMRYRLPQPWRHGTHAPQPFAQALVGAGHVGGGLAGAGDGTQAFVSRIGGGIDLPLGSKIALGVLQADYYRTNFPNTVNDHQNNLLLGAGIVFHWSMNK
jgi:hypothetical protein